MRRALHKGEDDAKWRRSIQPGVVPAEDLSRASEALPIFRNSLEMKQRLNKGRTIRTRQIPKNSVASCRVCAGPLRGGTQVISKHP